MRLNRPLERPQAHRDIPVTHELLPDHLGVVAVLLHLGSKPFIEPAKGA
jgi:hypothetical protein